MLAQIQNGTAIFRRESMLFQFIHGRIRENQQSLSMPGYLRRVAPPAPGRMSPAAGTSAILLRCPARACWESRGG
jgi:hypothetical protein